MAEARNKQLCASGSQTSRSHEAETGQTYEQNIFIMDGPILLAVNVTSGPRGKGNQEVKVQAQRRPKFDYEAWSNHQS